MCVLIGAQQAHAVTFCGNHLGTNISCFFPSAAIYNSSWTIVSLWWVFPRRTLFLFSLLSLVPNTRDRLSLSSSDFLHLFPVCASWWMVTPSLVDSSSSISNCLRIYPSFTSLTPKLFGERELNFSHDVYNLRKKIPCLNKFLVCLIAENAQLKKTPVLGNTIPVTGMTLKRV